jgi:hypothetical protein
MQRLKRSLWIFDIGLRRMNDDVPAGWMVHMGVFSTFALLLLAAVEFGLPMMWPLAIVGCLDLLATHHFLRWSLPRIGRLGPLGPTRARWWIEAAALDWTLCVSIGVFGITRAFPAVLAPAKYLLFLFFALAGIGFALGLVQGKRIRGRALELVAWFFWTTVVILAAMALVPDNPVLTDWVAPVLAVLSAVVLVAAGIVALRNQKDAPSDARGVRLVKVQRRTYR